MSGEHVTSTVSQSRKRTTSCNSSSIGSGRPDSSLSLNDDKKSDSACSPSREKDGSSSERSLTKIPPKTSQWNENHLSSLGVEIVFRSISSPINIVESVYKVALGIIKFEKKHENYEIIETKQFKQEILTNPPTGWVNLKKYKSINDILKTDLSTLKSQITSLNNVTHREIEGRNWLPGYHVSIPTSRLFARYRFYLMGEQFGRYLLYMAETKQKGEIITDKMYQTLFNLFLGMFGIFGNQAPPVGRMDINSEDVVSVPDMMVSQTGKIIAVIKVKNHLNKNNTEENESPLKTRKMSAGKDERLRIDHLDEHIVGQMGGDMLFHLKESASSENKILGIIVQESCVTFTYLEKQDDIEKTDSNDANTFMKGNYVIKFSKPYNYLDPEECEELMEPLILLSLLQNNPNFLIRS